MTKIEIPASLRNRIECFLANLNADMAATAAQREKLAAEQASLQVEAAQLIGKVQQLRSAAFSNAEFIGAFQNAETRQRLVGERLVQVGSELESLHPVSLTANGAESLLTDIVIFYSEALKNSIADALAPFCPNRNRAIQMAGLTPAFTLLRGVYNRAGNLRNMSLTPSAIQGITNILNRALSGNPLLTQSPETEEEH